MGLCFGLTKSLITGKLVHFVFEWANMSSENTITKSTTSNFVMPENKVKFPSDCIKGKKRSAKTRETTLLGCSLWAPVFEILEVFNR